jgi:GTPase SAR1 family protein
MSSEDFIESFYNLSALRSVTVNKTVIKVNMVLVGDDNTGKRSFMHAAVRGRLPEYLGSSEPPPPFIVVDVLGQKVLLQLIFWNIHSGMKREPFYILNRQTPLGFIFINISQPSTFEMAKILVQEMKTFMPGSPLFLIGTFGDMRIERENECVSQSAIMELVNKEQLNGYFETSILVNPREIEEVFRHCVQIFADSDFGRRFIINSLRYTEPVVAEHLKKLQNKKLKEIRSPSPSTKKRELQVKETKIKESKIKDKKVKRQSDTSHKAKENEIPNISPQSRKKQIEENERQKDVEQETLDTPRLRRTNARYCLAVQAEQYNNTEAELNCIPSLPPPPTLRLSTNSTTTSVPSTEIVFKSSEITATLGRKFDTPDRCSLIPVSSPRQVGPTFDSVVCISGAFHMSSLFSFILDEDRFWFS